ncbi:hypothetical protein [Alienimonas sp. DA493]|uniref:hypothetical protein n=1 Tax=Alienimonas sp. DA493 TaxID=3373605 RepID=UPI0037548AD7
MYRGESPTGGVVPETAVRETRPRPPHVSVARVASDRSSAGDAAPAVGPDPSHARRGEGRGGRPARNRPRRRTTEVGRKTRRRTDRGS